MTQPQTLLHPFAPTRPKDTSQVTGLRRRSVLALPWAALLGPELVHAQSTRLSNPQGGRFVMVFLRGAYDGLSALVPHSDPHYTQLRQSIAIPAPDGTAQSAIPLDDRFALHPELAPLLPLWQQGSPHKRCSTACWCRPCEHSIRHSPCGWATSPAGSVRSRCPER